MARDDGMNADAPPFDWIDVPEVPDEIITRECGNPVLAGSAVDLRFAADLTARAALDELGDGVAWNNLLWSREPLSSVHAELARPYATVLRTFPRHPQCPTCGRPRTAAVVLSPEAREAIVRFTEAKPDRETGGVLIGYEDLAGNAVVLDATDAGPNATETTTRYEHDVLYVNQRLSEAAERLGERGRYVGEWHSHLEPDPRPSPRDVESLSDIAAAPNYLTDEPVMVIAGLDPTTGRVAALHGSCFPIGRRMHEIPIRDADAAGGDAARVDGGSADVPGDALGATAGKKPRRGAPRQ
jgi:integrative and conjugative element protein (TIGR02256 family)